jgi:predicted nucleotidyltransferase
MNIQPNFEEFLRLLEDHGVDYMIIGGYAVAFHGFPRFTKDIDIFYEASPANIARLCRALAQFPVVK